MIEIIVGAIVLILAVIGIAKLAQWRGGGGGMRKDLSRIDIDATLNNAIKDLYALYNLAKTSPEYGSKIAKDVLNYVSKHEDEFKYALRILGYKEDKVYEWLEEIRKKYEKAFNEEIVRPTMEKISNYKKQESIIGTVLNESKLVGASWYAHFAGVIPAEEAHRDTREIVDHYRREDEIQKKASNRMAQARGIA